MMHSDVPSRAPTYFDEAARRQEYRARITAIELRTDAVPDGLHGCLAAGSVFAGFNGVRQSGGSCNCYIDGGYTARDGSHR